MGPHKETTKDQRKKQTNNFDVIYIYIYGQDWTRCTAPHTCRATWSDPSTYCPSLHLLLSDSRGFTASPLCFRYETDRVPPSSHVSQQFTLQARWETAAFGRVKYIE